MSGFEIDCRSIRQHHFCDRLDRAFGDDVMRWSRLQATCEADSTRGSRTSESKTRRSMDALPASDRLSVAPSRVGGGRSVEHPELNVQRIGVLVLLIHRLPFPVPRCDLSATTFVSGVGPAFVYLKSCRSGGQMLIGRISCQHGEFCLPGKLRTFSGTYPKIISKCPKTAH